MLTENIVSGAHLSIFNAMGITSIDRRNYYGSKAAISAFGATLRLEIEKAGTTATEVARAAKIDRSTVSAILTGRQSLDAVTAVRIAETLPPEACRRLLVVYAREIACAPLMRYIDITATHINPYTTEAPVPRDAQANLVLLTRNENACLRKKRHRAIKGSPISS